MNDKIPVDLPVVVVCVGILFHNDRVLIGLRPPGVRLAGLWEFPGGKLQPPESAAECLLREMREEVGLDVTIQRALEPIVQRDPDLTVELLAFICHLAGDLPSRPLRATANLELRWVKPAELDDYCFPPGNAPLLRSLASLLA